MHCCGVHACRLGGGVAIAIMLRPIRPWLLLAGVMAVAWLACPIRASDDSAYQDANCFRGRPLDLGLGEQLCTRA